ncbi:hypothetical protein ACVIJX_002199 [Bradyrhizobium diazoefficiens]
MAVAISAAGAVLTSAVAAALTSAAVAAAPEWAGAASAPVHGSAVAAAILRLVQWRVPGLGTAPSFSGGGGRNFAAAGSNWQGGGGNWNGGWRHHHRGGFWPGFAAGAAIGGLGSYAYYGGGYYNDPYYYGDDSYYDEPSVAVVPDSGGDSAGYCAQRYRSYDPASGTYLGYDGLRHPCP